MRQFPRDFWQLTFADFVLRTGYQMGKTPLCPSSLPRGQAEAFLASCFSLDGTARAPALRRRAV